MGDTNSTSSPLYHPATAHTRDEKLAALADDVQRKRKAKWVRGSTSATPDRLAKWAAASPEQRSALEQQWSDEDDAAAAAAKKQRDDENDRRQRVVDARERLRGAG